MKVFKKKLGLGSLSLLLFLIALILVIQYIYFSIGDDLMALLGKAAYPVLGFISPEFIYISFIFSIPSIFLGYRFKSHFGAKSGRSLSISLILVILAWVVGYNIGYKTDIFNQLLDKFL